jgi:hypothetical protein
LTDWKNDTFVSLIIGLAFWDSRQVEVCYGYQEIIAVIAVFDVVDPVV